MIIRISPGKLIIYIIVFQVFSEAYEKVDGKRHEYEEIDG